MDSIGYSPGGTIEVSYALGAVTGYEYVGGLIGYLGTTSSATSLTNAYAQGAVTVTGNGEYGGGLIGYLMSGTKSADASTVTDTYSVGTVTASTKNGGLVGDRAGSETTVTASYWDNTNNSSLSGAGNSGSTTGITGEFTTTLQASLPSTWSTSVWAIVAGQTFPFFSWQGVVSGTVYATYGGSAAGSGITVSDIVNGIAGGFTATTNASGVYELVLNSALSANSQLLVYTTGASVGAAYQQNASGSVTGLNIYGTYLSENTPVSAYSAVTASTGLPTAIGSNSTVQTLVNGLANLDINPTAASFTVDKAISTGTLVLSTTGTVTQSAPVTATAGLDLLGSGATYSLTNASNSVGTLAANTGTIDFNDGGSLTIGTVDGTAGATGSGPVTLTTSGSLTIASGTSVSAGGAGNDVVLSAAADFINDAGSSAVTASGNWLIYSNAPDTDTFGPTNPTYLNSNNTAIWDATIATLPAASVPAGGDYYLFAYQPTLTFTSTNVTKTYGVDDATAIAAPYAAYTVSGYQTGVANAFLGDSAANVYSGAPSVMSAGSSATANVTSSPYTITVTQSTVSATNGYALQFVSTGQLTIDPEAIIVTAAANQSKIYGTNDSTLTYSITGGTLYNSDSLSGSLSRADYGTLGGEQVGNYTITLGTLTASANYAVSLTPGATFTIAAASLNIAANAQSKTYGTDDPALSYGETGLLDGVTVDGVTLNDSLSGSLSRADYGTLAGEQVGSYAIGQGTVAVSAPNDYTVSYSGANLTIAAASLNIAANAQSKTYGTDDPALSYGETGLLDGVTVDGVTLNDSLSGSLSRADYGTLAGEQVGSYAITLGTLTASANYAVSLTPGATFTIAAASLNIAANAQSKTYGTDDPALSYGETGLLDGVTVDGVTLNDSLSGSLSRADYGTLAGEQVGSYAIGQGTVAVSAPNDYTVSYSGANLTIAAASLNIAANAQSKTYGTDDPALSYGETGLLDGVTVDGVTLNDSLSGSLSRADYGTLAGEQVGSYAITLGTLTASANYAVSLTPGATFTIAAASLNIAANAQSKTYGTDDPALSYGETGLLDGVTVDGVTLNDSLSGSLSRADYGTLAGEQVGSYAIGQGTVAVSAPNDYTVSYSGANLTIAAASLNIAANAQSKTYGTDDPALSYGETGLLDGVTVDGVTLNDSLSGSLSRADYGTLAGEQVGSYAITLGTLTASANYAVSLTPGATFTIAAASLNIAANAQSKTYGTDDPALSYGETGLLDGVTVDGVTLNDSLSGSLSRADYGTLAGEQVGSYAIGQGTVAVSAPNDYTVSYSGANLTIAAASLNIAANAQSKTYGTDDPALSYGETGLLDGVTVDGVTLNDSLSGSLSRADYGTLAGEQVGSYAITLGTLTASANYAVSLTPGATFTIAAASLNIAANAQSKTYGTDDPALSYGETGLLDGVTVDGVTLNDSLSGSLSRADYGTLAGEQVGSYAIGQGTVAVSAPNDYTVSYSGANLTIAAASLNIAANAQSKTYGTDDPALSYGETGLLDGVTVDGVTLNDSLSGSLSRADYGTLAGEQVGSYAITLGTLTASANYAVSLTPGATFTIAAASLNIAANAQSKTYGTDDPALSYGETGLLDGVTVDGVTLNDSLSGSLSRADYGTLAGEQVGSYAIGQGTVAVSAPNDYTVSYSGANLTIAAASLNIAANAQSKTYGTDDPALSYGETGLLDGVTVDGVTLNDSLSGSLSRADYGTLAGEQVGSYAIGQGTVAVSAPNDYTVSYSGANLTIAAASLNIAANAQSKTYGTDDPALSYGETGLLDGVTVDGVTLNDSLSGSLSRADYGTLAGEQVGSYAITLGTLTASANYAVSLTPGATFTIAAASLNIAANAQSKTYGTDDPALSYGETGLLDGVTVDGVTLNDSLSGSLSRADYGTLAGEQVGSYAIGQGTVAVSAPNDYTVSYSGANLTIAAASLNIAANAQSKTYGTDDPALSYGETGLLDGVTVDGVTLNDSLSGSLSRADYGTLAGEQVGSYAITLGTLTASANYAVSLTPGATFTIAAASLNIAANAQSKTYGTDDPALSYGETGLLDGVTVDGVTLNDSLSGSLSRADYGTLAGEQVGSYAIGQGTVAVSAPNDYTVSYSGANLTIAAASLNIAANAQSKTYGTDDPALSYGETGLLDGVTVDGVTLNDSLSGSLSRADYGTLAGEQVGSYAIGQGTVAVSAPNDYTVSYSGANLTIAAAAITYTADHVMVNYGTTLPTFTGKVGGLVDTVVDGVVINDYLGTAQFTSSATSLSPIGFYAINGSGLAADTDYVFNQAPGNAIALQIGSALSSTYTPPNSSNNPPTNPVNITFQTPNFGLIHVSLTPNGPNTANNQNNDVNPASLPPGDAFSHNNGFDFQPISQYDANQYSDFKAPDYDDDDSEATIFTILARAASPGHGGDYMIDNFWNGTGDTWPGAGHINLLDKVTFSDGTGHDVTPTNDDAFPIMPGKTDFAALLKNGPVMIGGPAGQTPAQWLLATGLTPDGKDIVCDDPISGTVVELAYNPATDTVGGIASIFDANSKGFVSLADAGNDIPAGTAGGLAALQSFTPSTYYAVTVH